jgi:hypothetical protein
MYDAVRGVHHEDAQEHVVPSNSGNETENSAEQEEDPPNSSQCFNHGQKLLWRCDDSQRLLMASYRIRDTGEAGFSESPSISQVRCRLDQLRPFIGLRLFIRLGFHPTTHR